MYIYICIFINEHKKVLYLPHEKLQQTFPKRRGAIIIRQVDLFVFCLLQLPLPTHSLYLLGINISVIRMCFDTTVVL